MNKDRRRLRAILFSIIIVGSLLALSLSLQPGRNVLPETLVGRQVALDEERRRLSDEELEQAKRRFMMALQYQGRYRLNTDLRNIQVGKTYRDDTNFGICGELLLRKSDGDKGGAYVGFIGIDDLQGKPIFIFEDDEALRVIWETVARNIGCISK